MFVSCPVLTALLSLSAPRAPLAMPCGPGGAFYTALRPLYRRGAAFCISFFDGSEVKDMHGSEIRTLKAEVRASPGAGGEMRFEGYAARFNSPSEDLGGFIEDIAPGAFA